MAQNWVIYLHNERNTVKQIYAICIWTCKVLGGLTNLRINKIQKGECTTNALRKSIWILFSQQNYWAQWEKEMCEKQGSQDEDCKTHNFQFTK